MCVIESQVPRVIAYSVYLDADENEMTVVQLQPDAPALDFHMEAGGPAFAKFKGLIRLTSMEVYGEITEGLRKRLLDKARMLGGSDEIVTFNRQQSGFIRSLGMGP